MNKAFPIPIPFDAVAEFCRQNHIRKMSLFGSILRDDFTPDSDVDVLVEFEEGYRPGLAFFTMDAELAVILGRTVDLNTRGWISPRFLDDVLSSAEPVYDAA